MIIYFPVVVQHPAIKREGDEKLLIVNSESGKKDIQDRW